MIRSCFTQHTHPRLQFRGYHCAEGASLFLVLGSQCSSAVMLSQRQAPLWDKDSQCGVMLLTIW